MTNTAAKLYTIKEVANLLRVPRYTIYNVIRHHQKQFENDIVYNNENVSVSARERYFLTETAVTKLKNILKEKQEKAEAQIVTIEYRITDAGIKFSIEGISSPEEAKMLAHMLKIYAVKLQRQLKGGVKL